MIWKGVIIEESLNNRSILKLVKVVKKRKTTLEKEAERGFLNFLYFELEDEKKDEFLISAIHSIKDKFYIHICKEKTIIVIFKNKIFKFNSKEIDKLNDARVYGMSIGILKEQMPFEKLIKNPYS